MCIRDSRHLIQLDHGSMQEILTIHYTLDQQHRASLKQMGPVSYTHLRAHETVLDIVCRLLLEKKKHKHSHTN